MLITPTTPIERSESAWPKNPKGAHPKYTVSEQATYRWTEQKHPSGQHPLFVFIVLLLFSNVSQVFVRVRDETLEQSYNELFRTSFEERLDASDPRTPYLT